MRRRWPLHPQPLPHESLSSWLDRLAEAYGLDAGDLLAGAFGLERIPRHRLDRDPQDGLVAGLSDRTGVPARRLRTMTLSGYVPWIVDTLDAHDGGCLAMYATQYRVLLRQGAGWMSKGIGDHRTGTYCLPWIIEPYGQEHLVCPACLAADAVPHLRIYWRLGLMASCPRHGCWLQDAADMPLNVWRRAPEPLQPASAEVLDLDAVTLQALTAGQVEAPGGGAMCAAVYVRLLRSLLEELFCRPARAGRHADRLEAVWQSVGQARCGGFSISKPFERQTLPQRRIALQAAGSVLCRLLRHGVVAGEGMHPRLPAALAELTLQRSHDGRDYPGGAGQGFAGGETVSPWLKAQAGVEALVELMRNDPAAVEEFLRMMEGMSHTPRSYWTVMLRDVGIDVAAERPTTNSSFS